MVHPLVGDLAGEVIPFTGWCWVLGISTTACRAWRMSPVFQRDLNDAHVINAAYDVYADDPDFGYRLIADELIHVKGVQVGVNRERRLCSLQGISSSILKCRGSGKKAVPAAHGDQVNPDFTANPINVK